MSTYIYTYNKIIYNNKKHKELKKLKEYRELNRILRDLWKREIRKAKNERDFLNRIEKIRVRMIYRICRRLERNEIISLLLTMSKDPENLEKIIEKWSMLQLADLLAFYIVREYINNL